MNLNQKINLINTTLPIMVSIKVMQESVKEGVELSREEIVKRADELLRKYKKDLGLE